MVDSSATGAMPHPEKEKNSLTLGFNKLVSTQYWRMMAERIIPRALPVIGVAGLFAGATMSGALASLPPTGKAATLVLFAAATAVTGLRLLTTKLPSTLDAVRRIDQASPTKHQVAENMYRDMHGENTSPVWRLHMQDMMREVPKLIAEDYRPSETVRKFAAPILLASALATSIGAYTGYGHYEENFMASFDMSLNVPPAPASRMNAWVTQPGYTGEYAPIVLHDSENGAQFAAREPVNVIEGSTLTVQLFDDKTELHAVSEGAESNMAMEVRNRGNTREFTITLTEDTQIDISRGRWEGLTWAFNVTQDMAPTVELNTLPGREGAAPRYQVVITDDFGADITEGSAVVDTAPLAGADATPLPQYQEPRIDLGLR